MPQEDGRSWVPPTEAWHSKNKQIIINKTAWPGKASVQEAFKLNLERGGEPEIFLRNVIQMNLFSDSRHKTNL